MQQVMKTDKSISGVPKIMSSSIKCLVTMEKLAAWLMIDFQSYIQQVQTVTFVFGLYRIKESLKILRFMLNRLQSSGSAISREYLRVVLQLMSW